jgi:hypothetical protein
VEGEDRVTLIDDLLGEKVTCEIDDGEGGRWEISLRPRRTGSPIVRTTMASFARPGVRGKGFGVQVWALRLMARSDAFRDPVAESSIRLTRAAARSALAWIDTIGEGEQK